MFSLPYILLFAFFGVLSFVYRKQDDEGKKMVRIACLIVYMMFFGFRGFVGDDWILYYRIFDQIQFSDIRHFSYVVEVHSMEPGFLLFMLLMKPLLFGSYALFTFACTFISLALLHRFLVRRVSNYPLALCFFLVMNGLVLQINLLRNFWTILIFLNCLEYIQQRRPWPYFLWMTFALSLHLSAVIYFPLYFFLHKQLPRWMYLAILLFFNVLFLLQVGIVAEILQRVASSMGEGYEKLVEAYTDAKAIDKRGVISIGYLERLITMSLFYCYYQKLMEIREGNAIFVNSFLIYIIMNLFFYEFEEISVRLSTLFCYSYWILWGDLLKCFHYPSNKRFFESFILVYCLLKTVSMMETGTMAYDNVLFGAKGYDERYALHQRYAPDK